jgi:flavin-dependent dehydrogenase
LYGARLDDLCDVRGHALPVRQRGTPVMSDRVLLVGDAAALVDPLSGEGIHSALVSAKLAAEAAAALLVKGAGLEGYQAAIEKELGEDLAFSRQLQRLLQATPALYVEMLKHSPRMWRKMVRIIRGETGYVAAREASGWLGRLVSAAARIVPEGPVHKAPGVAQS